MSESPRASQVLKDITKKILVTAQRRRAAVTEVVETVGRSARWGCRALGLAQSTWHYHPRRDPQPALRA